MPNGVFQVPVAVNEPVKAYAPGSTERESLLNKYNEMYNREIEISMFIGGKEVKSGKLENLTPPHDHQRVIGKFHRGDKSHVETAVQAALDAKAEWEATSWEHRASIFLKAAELLAGPFRDKMNAATMLAQSKNVHQAEIDAACEMIDFFRFNVQYMTELYLEQPESAPGIWNRVEHRPLEGFVFAITPFNFTSIAANLPFAPALMGNTVVWKPADSQIYSAQVIVELFKAAGVPDGVINVIYTDGPEAGDVIFNHRDFAGLHFTGSTGVFRHLWTTIGNNIAKYRSYPRIVGETGGKDFVVAHKTTAPQVLASNLLRGAFEFQGQKCSAASRAYVPSNIWPEVKEILIKEAATMKMGSPADPSNFINAVIDRKAFDKIAGYIDYINASDAEVITGGKYDDSKGYFVEPTIAVTNDPFYKTMVEEIFGPVLTIHVYDADNWEGILKTVDQTSEYALTGAIFGQDRYALNLAVEILKHAAGNFYINDKPTGAVVGQQPFGGARGSGTNDKAGSVLNLMRWVSPRLIKETFVSATDYRYPFLG